MVKTHTKSKEIAKGSPSGLVISLIVHTAAFFLAGILVVISVRIPEEVILVAPPAKQRPEMKIIKPKVKIKKNALPATPTRILVKDDKVVMTKIEIPGLDGNRTGTDFREINDLVKFDTISLLSTTPFGDPTYSDGNDFVGRFYDMKRTANGNSSALDTTAFKDIVGNFITQGWQLKDLDKYYQAPRTLHAKHFMVPTTHSATAPRAFGEPETGGWCWMALYKGDLVHQDGITFRFWGQGDDILLVRVNGQVVLNASWPGNEDYFGRWRSHDSKTRTYLLGNNLAVPGDWITLQPGVPLKMEVLCGEVPGGQFDMMLVVEEKDVVYEKNKNNAPIFPMFKTSRLTHEQKDVIYEWLVEGEASVTNGPVFSDFSLKKKQGVTSDNTEALKPEDPEIEVAVTETPEAQPAEESSLRIWTTRTAETIEAEYINRIGDKVILKTGKGRQIKVPFDALNKKDRLFIELSNPPTLSMSFIKSEDQQRTVMPPNSNGEEPRILEYTFGAKMKQMSARSYDYELTAEYFAFGQQRLDDRKFKLVDRDKSSFTLNNENKRSHRFNGERSSLFTTFTLNESRRGYKFMGHLIVVRDQRGKIIAHQTSNEWLFEKLDEIEQLPVGAFFDKTGLRVHPTGPRQSKLMN
jgi:hypothetical protein